MIGPGQDEVAVRLGSEVIGTLSIEYFRLLIVSLWVSVNRNTQDFQCMGLDRTHNHSGLVSITSFRLFHIPSSKR